MEDFDEVKITIRSLLTSSQKSLSIEELQRDYRAQEGKPIPFRHLGFNNVIELLQSMKDILNVPPNPNLKSMLTLVVGDKSNHLRMLVVKQKSSTKKKKSGNRFTYQGNSGNQMRNYRSQSFSESNFNQSQPTFNRSFINNYEGNGYNRYLSTNNSTNEKVFTKKTGSSDTNRNNSNFKIQNGFNSSPGYVTSDLKSYLEKNLSTNRMPISIDKFKELIKNHPDYMVLKAKSLVDISDKVKEFLIINENEVCLKNCYGYEKIELTDALNSSSENSSINEFKFKLNAPTTSSPITDKYESVNNNQSSVSDKNSSFMDDKMSVSKRSTSDVLENYKNQCMIRNLEDTSFVGKEDKNSDVVKNNVEKSIKNFEIRKNKTFSYGNKFDNNINTIPYGNRRNTRKLFNDNLNKNSNLVNNLDMIQSDSSTENKTTKMEFSNRKKKFNSTDNSNDISSFNQSAVTFSYSTAKSNNCASVNVNVDDKIQNIPKEVLFNIARIFNLYCKGVTIDNFKLIFSKIYHYVYKPTDFGFSSSFQMFKLLDQMVEIQNNVLYKKNSFAYFERFQEVQLKNLITLRLQQNNVLRISIENKLNISLHVEQHLFPLVGDSSKIKMLLAEAYNPSLFYLQLASKSAELDHLMKIMQDFYDKNPNKYCIQSENVISGSFYTSCYTTFPCLKQWYRVKVLKQVDSKIVEVIHVDYGTVDHIPMTELRFLKKEFCDLPCQAVQCCLTGYNELDMIPEEVTVAFLKFSCNKTLMVDFDDNFIFDKQLQILHVTLYEYDSIYANKFININHELTKWHLKPLK